MAYRAVTCLPAAAYVAHERGFRPFSRKSCLVDTEQILGTRKVVQCQDASVNSLALPSFEHSKLIEVADHFRKAALRYFSDSGLGQQQKSGVTKEQICKCMNNYSIEVTPAAAGKIKDFRCLGLQPHTTVNVTYLPNSKPAETVEVCRRLVDAQLEPVAHVPARSFRDLDEVDEYFKDLRAAGVQRILVLAGGVAVPRGKLVETMDILDSGLVTRHGFTSVGVAAHPEGHPDVAETVLMDALVRKARWAREQGIELYFATQFCFEPEPIRIWEAKVRKHLLQELGGDASSLPRIHLGLAGPAKIANLIKFATMSGVGQSIQFVTKHAGNAVKLMSTAAPDELLVGIATYQASEEECLIAGMHLYPFGGAQKTVKWANQVVLGSFSLGADGQSFVVE